MNRFSRWLLRRTNGWTLGAMTAIFILFSIFVLPAQARLAETRSNGSASPDSSFLYSKGDLYAMADAFGPEGRRAYVRARFTFDLAWPLVYAAFLTASIGWFLKQNTNDGSSWHRLNLLPIGGAGLDFLENILASIVMLRFPATTAVLDALVPFVTMLKWILVICSFVLLIALFSMWAVKKLGGIFPSVTS